MYFAKQISQRRKEYRLSEVVVAGRVGVSRSYIALIEGGKRLPSKKLLLKFAHAMNATKEEIISWYLKDVKEQIELAIKQ